MVRSEHAVRAKRTPSGRSCLPAHFPAEPTAATHRAVVLAQLLLAPEAHVQPVPRHVQVLGAEAGAAAEAPRGPGCRHGEAARARPAGFRRSTSGYAPSKGGGNQLPRVRFKCPSAERNEDSAPENSLRCRKTPPGQGRAFSPASSVPSARRGLIGLLYGQVN